MLCIFRKLEELFIWNKSVMILRYALYLTIFLGYSCMNTSFFNHWDNFFFGFFRSCEANLGCYLKLWSYIVESFEYLVITNNSTLLWGVVLIFYISITYVSQAECHECFGKSFNVWLCLWCSCLCDKSWVSIRLKNVWIFTDHILKYKYISC